MLNGLRSILGKQIPDPPIREDQIEFGRFTLTKSELEKDNMHGGQALMIRFLYSTSLKDEILFVASYPYLAKEQVYTRYGRNIDHGPFTNEQAREMALERLKHLYEERRYEVMRLTLAIALSSVAISILSVILTIVM